MKNKLVQRAGLLLVIAAACAMLMSVTLHLEPPMRAAPVTAEQEPVTEAAVEPNTTADEPPLPPLEVVPEEPEPRSSSAEYIGAEKSPNEKLYMRDLAVAGDSIASGFRHYGLIDAEHNIAQSAVSIWNLDYFTYDYGSGEVDTYGAVAYIKPAVLYFSVGMNDVNMYTAEEYAENYLRVIMRIRKISPDTVFIAAATTPIFDSNDFTSNEEIRMFNSALEEAVNSLNDDHVWYFDAYSVVADEETLALREDNSAGDGMHLAEHCYQDLLDCLFAYLDSTPARDIIMKDLWFPGGLTIFIQQ
ncbi:MAG: SGNH/GDSL hydrolase family protein [Ruminococcus sp.]|nr:SGNH/GDSL hydrolase family protein [Ruminococcus sp.]